MRTVEKVAKKTHSFKPPTHISVTICVQTVYKQSDTCKNFADKQILKKTKYSYKRMSNFIQMPMFNNQMLI